MRNIGIWVTLGLVGLAVVGLVLFPPSGETEPRIAPEFALRSLDGETVSLSSYRGQVVVLDFWASWCKPCRTSFPELHEMAASLADEGVVLLVITIDKTEEIARDYLVEHEFSTDNVLWGSLDEARAVKSDYGVIGIPHTFVIDREGLIRYSGHPNRLNREKLMSWI